MRTAAATYLPWWYERRRVSSVPPRCWRRCTGESRSPWCSEVCSSDCSLRHRSWLACWAPWTLSRVSTTAVRSHGTQGLIYHLVTSSPVEVHFFKVMLRIFMKRPVRSGGGGDGGGPLISALGVNYKWLAGISPWVYILYTVLYNVPELNINRSRKFFFLLNMIHWFILKKKISIMPNNI